jgi:hypothetical protein
MTTPPITTEWVPIWPLSDPPAQLPTPISGRWLKGGAGGAMSWEVIPGIVQADTGWHIIGAAGEPGFVNGWDHYPAPYGPGRFRKLASGLVVMEGLIRSGVANSLILTMPVGYRPTEQVGGGSRDCIFQTAVGSTVAAESVRIDSGGALRAMTPSASYWLALNDIQYYAG